MPGPKIFRVLLIYASKGEPEAHKIAKALLARGLPIRLDLRRVTPDDPQRDWIQEGLKADSVVILLGSDGPKLWSKPRMYSFLSEWIQREESLIPVLLPGASLPEFFRSFSSVDFRRGITDEGLDHLEWGITGRKPGRKIFSKNLPPADDTPPLTPEELLHLAFRLVVARRTGPDLLLHLDAARLREAMEGVLDESSHVASFPQLRLRAVATWLAEQFPGAHPDPLWQNWMLVTQRKTLEDLAAALASPPSSSAPPA